MSTSARERRETWLLRRRVRDLDRPHPLAVGYINCGAASWPNDRAKVARILNRAARKVDVLLFSEAFNIDARDELDDEWAVHHNTSTGAKAGSGVAVHRSRGRIKRRRLILAVTAVLGRVRADRMRDRHIALAHLRLDPGTPHRWSLSVAALHAPPPRNRRWWLPFMCRVAKVRAHVLAGDWNAVRGAVAAELGGDRRVAMRGIDGFAIADWIRTGPLEHHDVGSDHPLVTTVLWP